MRADVIQPSGHGAGFLFSRLRSAVDEYRQGHLDGLANAWRKHPLSAQQTLDFTGQNSRKPYLSPGAVVRHHIVLHTVRPHLVGSLATSYLLPT